MEKVFPLLKNTDTGMHTHKCHSSLGLLLAIGWLPLKESVESDESSDGISFKPMDKDNFNQKDFICSKLAFQQLFLWTTTYKWLTHIHFHQVTAVTQWCLLMHRILAHTRTRAHKIWIILKGTLLANVQVHIPSKLLCNVNVATVQHLINLQTHGSVTILSFHW